MEPSILTVKIVNEHDFCIKIPHDKLKSVSNMYDKTLSFESKHYAEHLNVDLTDSELILLEKIIIEEAIDYDNIDIIELSNIIDYMNISNDFIIKKIKFASNKFGIDWMNKQLFSDEDNYRVDWLLNEIMTTLDSYKMDVFSIPKNFLECDCDKIHRFIAKQLYYHIIIEEKRNVNELAENNSDKNEKFINTIVDIAKRSKETENPKDTFAKLVIEIMMSFVDKIEKNESIDGIHSSGMEFIKKNYTLIKQMFNLIGDVDKINLVILMVLEQFGFEYDIDVLSDKEKVKKIINQSTSNMDTNVHNNPGATDVAETLNLPDNIYYKNNKLKKSIVALINSIQNSNSRGAILKYFPLIHSFIFNKINTNTIGIKNNEIIEHHDALKKYEIIGEYDNIQEYDIFNNNTIPEENDATEEDYNILKKCSDNVEENETLKNHDNLKDHDNMEDYDNLKYHDNMEDYDNLKDGANRNDYILPTKSSVEYENICRDIMSSSLDYFEKFNYELKIDSNININNLIQLKIDSFENLQTIKKYFINIKSNGPVFITLKINSSTAINFTPTLSIYDKNIDSNVSYGYGYKDNITINFRRNYYFKCYVPNGELIILIQKIQERDDLIYIIDASY